MLGLDGEKSKPESRTFDKLRVESHITATTQMPLSALRPTSNVILNHIQRAYFVSAYGRIPS